MSDLLATIQAIVRQELARQRIAELAIVQEQHPHASDGDADNYACTVALRDSGVVLRRVPLVTGRLGLATVPDVGDLVLVQFVGGDLNRPVIVGALYDDQRRPPVNQDGQAVLHLPRGAGEGEGVRCAVSSAESSTVELTIGGALALTLADDDPVVTLDVDGGAATLVIDRDGSVRLESRSSLALAGADIEIKASGSLVLDGATIDIG